jgi:hypothetical protein
MRALSRRSTVPFALAVLAMPAWGGVSAQEDPAGAENPITVVGQAPTDLTDLTEGPEIEGVISARQGETIQVTAADGAAEARKLFPQPVAPVNRIDSPFSR